jgi:hypothetical protein
LERLKKKQNWLNRKKTAFLGINAIHGHFMPYKYVSYKKDKRSKFIIWLRDPIERAVSTYYFWKSNPTLDNANNSFKRIMIEEDWDLEKFCFAPQMKSTLHNWLWNFKLEWFDFIGMTESFDTDCNTFLKKFYPDFYGMAIPKVNSNKNKVSNYADHLSNQLIDKLRVQYALDYQVYHLAKKIRNDL